jgi:hypothetical protein
MDAVTVGTLSVNAATNTDIAVDLKGILQIDIVDAPRTTCLAANCFCQIDVTPTDAKGRALL